MNVAASNAPALPVASRPDVVGTGHVVPSSDGSDATAGAQGTSPGFGRLLSQHLAGGRDAAAGNAKQSAVGSGDPAVDAASTPVDLAADAAKTAALATDATTIVDAASGVGAVVPQELYPTLGIAKGMPAVDGQAGAGKGDADADDDPTTDAGADLAAQLALVAQWAGAAQPVVPTPTTAAAVTAGAAGAGAIGSATGAPGRGVRDAADVRGRLDALRTTAAGGEAAETATAVAATASATTVDGKTLLPVPALPAGSTPVAHDDARPKNAEALAAAVPNVVAASDDAKVAAAALAVATAGDAMKSAAGPRTGAETAAIGDAFMTRLAAHLSTATIQPSASTTTSDPTAPTSGFLQETVGTPAWSHEVGSAALRMAANDLQSASLRLNPEHLGPMDVQVRVENGMAHIAFTAAHADTRQALEASKTTLDQMFNAQGIRMGDVSVGGSGADASASNRFDFGGAQADAQGRRDGGTRWSGDDAADGAQPVGTVTARISRALGLVDTFA